MQKFTCSICLKVFSSRRGLITHHGMKHQNKTARKQKRKLQITKALLKYNHSIKGKRRLEKYERSVKGQKRKQKYRSSAKYRRMRRKNFMLKKEKKQRQQQKKIEERKRKELESERKERVKRIEKEKQDWRRWDMNEWNYRTFGPTALRIQKAKWKNKFGSDNYFDETNEILLGEVEQSKLFERVDWSKVSMEFVGAGCILGRNYMPGSEVEYVFGRNKDFKVSDIRRGKLLDLSGLMMSLQEGDGKQVKVRVLNCLIKLPVERLFPDELFCRKKQMNES